MRTLTGIQIFVASPGGLKRERQAFHSIVERLNSEEARASGVSVIPAGWEYTSAGVGRPQELINAEVRESDYLIVILWNKWGRPPGGENGYTSGTEEEFNVGLECMNDAAAPMRNILVMFKGVPDEQLSDPGPELQKVLDFKARLEEERQLLYNTFDTDEEFDDLVRTHLSAWLREWRGDQPPAKAVIPPRPDADADTHPSEHDEGESLLERAVLAAGRGRLTQAQQLFAQATSGPYDREALTAYVRFSRQSGRLGLAEQLGHRLLLEARDSGDIKGEIEGLSTLGLISRLEGHRVASVKYWDQALVAVSELISATENDPEANAEAHSTRAFLLDNRALTYRRMAGRMGKAMDDLVAALEERSHGDDEVGRAHTLRNLGVLQMQVGHLRDAEQSLRNALDIFEGQNTRGTAATLSALGDVLEIMQRDSEAVGAVETALALNTDLTNRHGSSMNFAQLSRLFIKAGQLERAMDYAERCMRINESVGSREGIAVGLHSMAKVLLAEHRDSEARSTLEDALEIFKDLDQTAGIASALIDLAVLDVRAGERSAALERVERARQILDEAPHEGLRLALEDVRRSLHQ